MFCCSKSSADTHVLPETNIYKNQCGDGENELTYTEPVVTFTTETVASAVDHVDMPKLASAIHGLELKEVETTVTGLFSPVKLGDGCEPPATEPVTQPVGLATDVDVCSNRMEELKDGNTYDSSISNDNCEGPTLTLENINDGEDPTLTTGNINDESATVESDQNTSSADKFLALTGPESYV